MGNITCRQKHGVLSCAPPKQNSAAKPISIITLTKTRHHGPKSIKTSVHGPKSVKSGYRITSKKSSSLNHKKIRHRKK